MPLRKLTALTLCTLLIPGPAALAQVGPACVCPIPAPTPSIDNRDGYLVLFEETPVHPMEISENGQELWVTSIPDASVSVFNIQPSGNLGRLQTEIEVGLGPVTVRKRPNSGPFVIGPIDQTIGATRIDGDIVPLPVVGPEIWVVCQSSNSLYIIDQGTKRVVETIRTPFEPADLVFTDDGKTGYVSLSASDQIAIVNAVARTVSLAPIEFEAVMPLAAYGVPVHAEEPRALLLDGNDLFGLSFFSGNGTLLDEADIDGDGETADIANLWDFQGGTNPAFFPPDREVLRFDTQNPSQTGDAVIWRAGTINNDLEKSPANGLLYISNVDLLNEETEHKFDYKANGFSVHQISYAAPSATNAPQASTNFIDLNTDVDPSLPNFRCSNPNEMAFTASGSLLFVACYETRNTAVVDTASDTVIAELRATPGTTDGFGPRGVTLNESKNRAYVYNQADNTVQVFDITQPIAVGLQQNPTQTRSAGFDITPEPILAGRRHFIDATNSGTGLETCHTCHQGGEHDRLPWDLADFTGDLPNVPEPRDDNNIKITMSLRGIEETPHYHWQGNRDDLEAFNAAFDGLLGGAELGDPELAEFLAFTFALSYPPNPNQDPDRVYSSDAASGFCCFDLVASVTVSHDTIGFSDPAARTTFTCTDCHGMDGSSGTNNQVVNDGGGFVAAGDPTQLRGMFDKESDQVCYDPNSSCPPNTVLGDTFKLPATGWGFLNPGVLDTLLDFAELIGVFQTNPQTVGASTTQQLQVTAFMNEFDSGMAPSTAFAWTLNQGNAGTPNPPPLAYQIPQASLPTPHSDLVVRGWLRVGGTPTTVGMLYNPQTSMFDTDITGQGPFTFNQLVNRASNGNGVFTFAGVPLGSGYRYGLDNDMDQLPDGDEPASGTTRSAPDFDGDGFPDGYEVRLGSNPADINSLPGPDVTAPVIQNETVAWVNSQVARVRWSTDEEATSRVRVEPGGGGAALWSGQELQFKTEHTMVVRGLDPGQTYDIVIEADDPAMPANTGSSTVLTVGGGSPAVTQQHLFQSLHIQQTGLSVVTILPFTLQYVMKADFTVVDEQNQPVSNAVVSAKFVDWVPGGGTNSVQTAQTAPSNAAGVATVSFTTVNALFGSGGTAEVMVDLADQNVSVIDTANRLYFHPLDGEFQYWQALGNL